MAYGVNASTMTKFAPLTSFLINGASFEMDLCFCNKNPDWL